MEVQLQSLLTSELDEGLEPDSHSGRLTFVERRLDNH
jgi:hypothetical protein